MLAWIFKPLATLLIIARAWPRGADAPAARRWVLSSYWAAQWCIASWLRAR